MQPVTACRLNSWQRMSYRIYLKLVAAFPGRLSATDDGLSVEQVQLMQLQASIVPYTAEQVINWKTTVINGRKYLSLVVLEESYLQADDEFSHEKKQDPTACIAFT